MIFLSGGAGNGNLGDELIVDAWLSYLANAETRKTVYVDGFHAGIHERLFGERYQNIKFTDVLGKLRFSGPEGFFDSLRRGAHFF